MKIIKRVIGKIISISALLVLCLTFALGVAGCEKENDPNKEAYWYGKYEQWEYQTKICVRGITGVEKGKGSDFSGVIDIDAHGFTYFRGTEVQYCEYDWNPAIYGIVERDFRSIPEAITISAKGLTYGDTLFDEVRFLGGATDEMNCRFIFNEADCEMVANTGTDIYEGKKIRIIQFWIEREVREDENLWKIRITQLYKGRKV